MLKLKINEKGLTLVEILVVLVIAAGIMIAATSIYIQGINNNNRILQETKLREEGDYLMSILVKEFYTLKKSDVLTDMTNVTNRKTITYKVAYKKEYETSTLNSCDPETAPTPRQCEVVSGFIENGDEAKLYIKGLEVKPMYNDIKIGKASSISVPTDSSFVNQAPSYLVELTLVDTKKSENNEITFKNEIALINN